MLPLNDSQHGEIIGLYKNNVPNHKISRILGFHRTTVSRTIKKYLDQKDFTTKNSAGRSKLINKEGQKIHDYCLGDHFSSKNFWSEFYFFNHWFSKNVRDVKLCTYNLVNLRYEMTVFI